jgi:hypothetical protein
MGTRYARIIFLDASADLSSFIDRGGGDDLSCRLPDGATADGSHEIVHGLSESVKAAALDSADLRRQRHDRDFAA